MPMLEEMFRESDEPVVERWIKIPYWQYFPGEDFFRSSQPFCPSVFTIDSPLKPKGKTTYEIETDRAEHERSPEEQEDEQHGHALIKTEQPGVDSEAKWIKKTGKTRYGYKRHRVTDTEGLVIRLLTAAANVNEIANLEDVLATADLPENIHVYGDKGWNSNKKVDKISKRSKQHYLNC